jgi:MSHA biogenesis protein MshO
MRPTRPERGSRSARGLTLIEMVVAMVIVGIVVAAVLVFASPVRQAVDLTARAELTDIADNALQRIGRDVRLALPNSVRVNGAAVEFIPVLTAGRYRGEGDGLAGGTNCPNDTGEGVPANDQLSFDFAAGDTCFKSIGAVPNGGQITNNEFLVLNNYGQNFPGQDAYEASAANRVQITGSIVEASRQRISFGSTTFQRALHDSPGRRFYVVQQPVSYVCSAGILRRHWNYGFQPAQPGAPGGASAVIAENVSGCAFEYAANVAPQVGLLTLRLTLAKILSGGETETVTLYHAVHVSNLP